MSIDDKKKNSSSLKGKTVIITGASRGIGKAIAMRVAREGANVVIAAKTVEPHPVLPGTIYDTVSEIENIGGHAFACQLDIRNELQIAKVMKKAVEHFGGIDALVNNASAISLTGTLETSMKRFDLMFSVNVRGTYAASQAAIPYLLKSGNPHILNISPPLNMNPKWFKDHVAYTMAKYGMSMCVLGMAQEFSSQGLAVNALWPMTSIATVALKMTGGSIQPEQSRTPEIMSDAVYAVLTRNSRELSGQFLIDEEVLREEGIEDFSNYAVNPHVPLFPDLFLE